MHDRRAVSDTTTWALLLLAPCPKHALRHSWEQCHDNRAGEPAVEAQPRDVRPQALFAGVRTTKTTHCQGRQQRKSGVRHVDHGLAWYTDRHQAPHISYANSNSHKRLPTRTSRVALVVWSMSRTGGRIETAQAAGVVAATKLDLVGLQ